MNKASILPLLLLLLLVGCASYAAADGFSFPGCTSYKNSTPTYRVVLSAHPSTIAADGKSEAEITIDLVSPSGARHGKKPVKVAVDGEEAIRELVTDQNGTARFIYRSKGAPGYYKITADTENCAKSAISSIYVIEQESVACGANTTISFMDGDKRCGLNISKEDLHDPRIDELITKLEKSRIDVLADYWVTGNDAYLNTFTKNEAFLFTPEEIVEALSRIRAMYGRHPLAFNTALALAAKNSSNYLRIAGLSYDRVIHTEYKDGIGFTGTKPSDRMAHVGYPNGKGELGTTTKGNIISAIKGYNESAYHLTHLFGSETEIGFCLEKSCDGTIEFGDNKPRGPRGEAKARVWPPDGVTLYTYNNFSHTSEIPDPFPSYTGGSGTIMFIMDSPAPISSVRLLEEESGNEIPLIFEKRSEAAMAKGKGLHELKFMNTRLLLPEKTYRIQWTDENGGTGTSVFKTARKRG